MNKMSLAGWQGRPRPDGRRLEGKFVFLEKLSAAKHGTDLGEVLAGEPIAGLYDYLGDPPPRTAGEVISEPQPQDAAKKIADFLAAKNLI